MLAAIGDYLAIWQLPLMAILLFGWLLGGGYLFQRTLSKATQNKRFSFAKGVQVSLLAGLAGVITAGLLYLVGSVLIHGGTPELPISIPGVILALLGLLGMSLLVVWAMFPLELPQIARACVLPVGAIFALFVVILVGAGIPTYYTRQSNIQRIELQHTTIERFQKIYNALLKKGREQPPETLQRLVELQLIEPEDIQSPASTKGFFYHPPEVINTQNQEERKVILCDFRSTFPGKGRTVLYENGLIEFLPEPSFQNLMLDPVNEDFDAALRKAEQP